MKTITCFFRCLFSKLRDSGVLLLIVSTLEHTHTRLAFYTAFLNIYGGGVLTALAWLVPHETAAVSAYSVYTMQPCTVSHHAKPHT